MEYIKSKLQLQIQYLETANDKEAQRELCEFYRIRIEYNLLFLLGYLWNKNVEKVDIQEKDYIYKNIVKPTIGQVINICKKLDVDNEFFKSNAVNSAIDNYRIIRNEKLGHGYLFSKDIPEFLADLKGLYEKLLRAIKHPIFDKDVDFIKVNKIENNTYKGISYKSNGANFTHWTIPIQAKEFQVGSLYLCYENNSYFRLSPFIELDNANQAYTFYSVEDRLLGKLRYNGIFETSENKKFKEWEELCVLDLENDGTRRRSVNGTVLNVFDNNYTKYIDISIIKNSIKDFLQAKSSVCLTVWGHGGVGKTATVQSVCEDLSFHDKKQFDYIIFLSAKDIRYDYYIGEIKEEDVNGRIENFEAIIQNINFILTGHHNSDAESILNYQGQMLIVIDDFETFEQDDREKISDFINKLDIRHHKVIITTRLFNLDVVGLKVTTNELNEKDTIKFLLKVIENELPELNINLIKNAVNQIDNSSKIYHITSGRPLFIFQFAFTIGTQGSIENALKFDISNTEKAIKFLYGRVYNSLSKTAKDIFVVISLLVTQSSLSNVIDKIKYILGLENREDEFYSAIIELRTLKIITIDEEKKFFEIYSKEILQIMSDFFESRERNFKGSCIARFNQVNKDKELDAEQSLLRNANESRLSKSKEEVIKNYREIILRNTSPDDVKLNAILNLSAYLVGRSEHRLAIQQFEEFYHRFNNNGLFAKMYAVYLWSNTNDNGQKKLAINVLLEYTSLGFNLNSELNLEIAGMLLMYRCISMQTDWQELEDRKRYKEISFLDFDKLRKDQEQVCLQIHNDQGIKLFRYIETKKLTDFSTAGVKQNVISGLFQFTEICINLYKFDLAKEICEYILYFAPKHFHSQFEFKLKKIKSLIYHQKNKNKHSNYTGKKSENFSKNNDFADKLKNAIDKKKKE